MLAGDDLGLVVAVVVVREVVFLGRLETRLPERLLSLPQSERRSWEACEP